MKIEKFSKHRADKLGDTKYLAPKDLLLELLENSDDIKKIVVCVQYSNEGNIPYCAGTSGIEAIGLVEFAKTILTNTD